MDWISVDDKMPESVKQFEMFIVCTDKGVGFASYDSVGGFSGVHISGNVQYSDHDVSHWMPLPPKP